MIKVRFFNMHMNRSANINDVKGREEDKAYIDSFNHSYIPSHDYTWKNIQLTMDDDYDYAVVLDCVYRHYDNNGNKIDYGWNPSKTILLYAEPKMLRDRFDKNIYNEENNKEFLRTFHMNSFWGWLGLGIDDFYKDMFQKTKTISSIISANSWAEGHIKRLIFLRDYLSKIPLDHFGDERGLNGVFSKDPYFSKNYRGKIEQKKTGLLEYFYHFNAENCCEKDYFTEKIIEPILSECLTFYDGCPNLEDYFGDAFIRINLDDPENALYTIKRSIRTNEYEKRIDKIKEAKKKIIEDINVVNLMWLGVNNLKGYWEE